MHPPTDRNPLPKAPILARGDSTMTDKQFLKTYGIGAEFETDRTIRILAGYIRGDDIIEIARGESTSRAAISVIFRKKRMHRYWDVQQSNRAKERSERAAKMAAIRSIEVEVENG